MTEIEAIMTFLTMVVKQKQKQIEEMEKFERLLNIEINEFPELGLYTADAFDNKEEDEDSKLAVIDPLTNEKIKEAKDDQDDCKEVNFESL